MAHEQNSRNNQARRSDSTILLVGGNGGMSDQYRAIAEERGLSLRHVEQRMPPGLRHSLGNVVAIIVVIGMVSHALRDQARELLPQGAKIVYVRTASVSSIRKAVSELSEPVVAAARRVVSTSRADAYRRVA